MFEQIIIWRGTFHTANTSRSSQNTKSKLQFITQVTETSLTTHFNRHKMLLYFTLEQAMKTQEGRRGTARFFNFCARWGWVVNAVPPPLYPRKTSGSHCTEGWVDRHKKFCPPVGFNPWTIQPITNCYIPNTKITYFFVYKVMADPGGYATYGSGLQALDCWESMLVSCVRCVLWG